VEFSPKMVIQEHLINIVAVIKGVSVNNDGAEKASFSAPSIKGQRDVILGAHIDAGIQASDISYIETHGTATPLGDPIEITALKEAFSVTTSTKQFCGIGSIKTNLGHLTASAGVVGLIKTALMLKNQTMVASINCSSPNSALNLDKTAFYVNTKKQQWKKNEHLRMAGVSSFGIGGTNAHVVLAENDVENTKKASEEKSDFQLPICISAKNDSALLAYISSYSQYLEKTDNNFQDIAISSILYRESFAYRYSIVAANNTKAAELLNKKSTSNRIPKTYIAKKLVFLYPGQGTQTIAMGCYLYQHLALFRKYFDQCNELLINHHELNIKEIIFNSSEDLNKTVYAQPALFVISYALTKCFEEVNIKPDYTFGHSIGEFVSAGYFEVFDLKTALYAVVIRGQAMFKQPHGKMLAVSIDAQMVKKYLTEHQ